MSETTLKFEIFRMQLEQTYGLSEQGVLHSKSEVRFNVGKVEAWF